jgi:hypothetical protein
MHNFLNICVANTHVTQNNVNRDKEAREIMQLVDVYRSHNRKMI